jgi:hypothetical protein
MKIDKSKYYDFWYECGGCGCIQVIKNTCLNEGLYPSACTECATIEREIFFDEVIKIEEPDGF